MLIDSGGREGEMQWRRRTRRRLRRPRLLSGLMRLRHRSQDSVLFSLSSGSSLIGVHAYSFFPSLPLSSSLSFPPGLEWLHQRSWNGMENIP